MNPPCPQNTCRNPFIGFQSPDGGGGAGRWLRWCPGCSPSLHRDGEAAPAELRKQAVVAGAVDRADRDEAVDFAPPALPPRQPERVARFDQAMHATLRARPDTR